MTNATWRDDLKPESIDREDGTSESVGSHLAPPAPRTPAAPPPPPPPRKRLPGGDTVAAVAFLRYLTETLKTHPFHTLTAIHIDPVTHEKGPVETRSFREGDWLGISKWIEPRQGMANLYWAVNPLREPKNSKSSKFDVAEYTMAQVDIDCPEGEPQEPFVERTIHRLPALRLEPSFVIDSGGGIQVFYAWQDRLPLNGDTKAIAEAGALTKGIQLEVESALGEKADSVFDCSRIMRLPGTINVPHIEKIKKGRVPRPAKLLRKTDLRYPRSAFNPAPQDYPPPGKGLGPTASAQPEGAGVSFTFVPAGPYERVARDDERLAALPEDLKRLIFEGDVANKYGGDRSRAAIAASRGMWKHDVPADVQASLFMSEKVGECVRDKGSSVNYHLKRTIERGFAFNHNPRLHSMNERHHVIDLNGKTRVLTWKRNELGFEAPSYSSFTDFKALHSNVRVEQTFVDAKGKPTTIYVGAGEWWLNQAKRAQYDGIVYAPNTDAQTLPGNLLNLWRGFAVSPKEGDCSLYLNHVRDNICQGNEEYFSYLLGWMAYAVQYPDRQGEVAVIVRGKKGTGKTVFAKQVGSLYGKHFKTVVNPDHLTGKFNAHLQHTSVLFADECFFAGDRRHEQILKALVTDSTIFVEPKGVDGYLVQNFLHIILATNSKWAVPASSDERRYFVVDVGEDHIQDHAYFDAITKQMDSGGREALLHFLLSYDISKFNVRKVPRTEALREQISLTRSGVDALVEKVCSEGQVPCGHAKFPGYSVSTPRYDDPGFDAFIEKNADNDLRRLGALRVKLRLRKEWGCRANDDGRKRDGKTVLSGIVWPPLDQLRATFVERHGPQTWLNPDATAWPAAEPAAKAQTSAPADDEIPF